MISSLFHLNRKGISSIVGGIFFLVLMTAGFTVYYVALDSQSQMLDTQQVIADSEVAKIQEKFIIAASSDPGQNNLLSVQVVNTGNNPIEVADLWIINKTDASEPAIKYDDLNYKDVSIPVGYSGNILENHSPLNLIDDVYDIKVVSSIGTIKTIEFDVSGGSNILKAQMVAIPQDVRYNENATVTLIVTNTGDFTIDTVEAGTLNVSPNQCSAAPNPIFTGPTTLAPSQSTMFFWDCILQQPIGNDITFTANATGYLSGVQIFSNNAYDTVTVRDFSAGNFGDELILKDELFGKPELFMVISNVFGDTKSGDNGRGYWGVNIANPTPKNMTVNKVSISAIRGNANDNASVFSTSECNTGGASPDLVMVSPTYGWDCPNDNVLTWKSASSPIIIPPQSAYPFIVEIRPGSVVNNGLQTVLVSSSTFTSLGAFGKGPYETSISHSTREEAIVNVYMQDAASGGNILGVVPNLLSQQQVLFNATLADFSEDSQAIDEISELVINIPKEWTFDSIYASSGFDSIVNTTFPDNSTQIVGGLSANLDNSEAVIQFYATAPGNTSGNAKMYVFHILGSGITTGIDTYFIGPVAETIVQVCPTSGGPTGCP